MPDSSIFKTLTGPGRIDSRCDEDGNLCVRPPVNGRPSEFFVTDMGDGTGTWNLIGNYSAAATDFFYLADATYDVYELLISISDNSKFNQTFYGGLASGLTNGIKFFLELADGVTRIPLLSTELAAVKQNFHWCILTPHILLTSFDGVAQTLSVTFELREDYGMPFAIAAGQKFVVQLQDDFTGLVSHTFALRGVRHV